MMKAILLVFIPLLIFSDMLVINSKEILDKHNELRLHHFNAPLTYSTTLEKESEIWAQHLAKTNACKMKHSGDKYGENLFWASTSIHKTKKSTDKKWTIHKSAQNISASKPVQDWYNEITFYNYDLNSCKKGEMCGHYTQVVWKDTKEVGCAAYVCEDFSQVWVCKYAPAGNYTNQKPY